MAKVFLFVCLLALFFSPTFAHSQEYVVYDQMVYFYGGAPQFDSPHFSTIIRLTWQHLNRYSGSWVWTFLTDGQDNNHLFDFEIEGPQDLYEEGTDSEFSLEVYLATQHTDDGVGMFGKSNSLTVGICCERDDDGDDIIGSSDTTICLGFERVDPDLNGGALGRYTYGTVDGLYNLVVATPLQPLRGTPIQDGDPMRVADSGNFGIWVSMGENTTITAVSNEWYIDMKYSFDIDLRGFDNYRIGVWGGRGVDDEIIYVEAIRATLLRNDFGYHTREFSEFYNGREILRNTLSNNNVWDLNSGSLGYGVRNNQRMMGFGNLAQNIFPDLEVPYGPTPWFNRLNVDSAPAKNRDHSLYPGLPPQYMKGWDRIISMPLLTANEDGYHRAFQLEDGESYRISIRAVIECLNQRADTAALEPRHSGDCDPVVGISDGTNFIGFARSDPWATEGLLGRALGATPKSEGENPLPPQFNTGRINNDGFEDEVFLYVQDIMWGSVESYSTPSIFTDPDDPWFLTHNELLISTPNGGAVSEVYADDGLTNPSNVPFNVDSQVPKNLARNTNLLLEVYSSLEDMFSQDPDNIPATGEQLGIHLLEVNIDRIQIGCDLVEGSFAEWDMCDPPQCGGMNASCTDCFGEFMGSAVMGPCGCNDFTSCLDCDAQMGGNLTLDACGVCGGNNDTCCVDYLDVWDRIWDWLLTPVAIADTVEKLKETQSYIEAECMLFMSVEFDDENPITPSPGEMLNLNRQYIEDCLDPFAQSLCDWLDMVADALDQENPDPSCAEDIVD